MTDVTTVQRILSLEGGCNFRDFGGYQTTEGRSVRWKRLYRSGVMAHMSDRDAETVRALGIRSIIDMRREKERVKEPTRWPGAEVRVRFQDHALDAASLNWIVRGQDETVSTARDALIGLYRSMPVWLITRLQDLFNSLADDEVPLLLHCSAGKDRTGFGAALVLEVLGVPRDTVLRDYALTNEAVNLEAFILKHHASNMGLGDEEHPLFAAPADARAAMLAADPDYLIAALECVDQDHGSVAAYVSRTLGLGDEGIEKLRERLLTD